jgi:hypothetical protein
MKPVKKILILSANPEDTSRLHLDKEVREIEEGLLRSKHRGQFEIQTRWAVRFWDLRRLLLDYEPQIVHFSGHGEKQGLIVEGELGIAVPISPEALSELFRLCSGHVECVLLNTCYSKAQADAINKHINCVIGMPGKIEDRAAFEFAVGFYDALGAGKSVEEAYKFGCNAVKQVFPNIPHHLIPVLKKREGLKKQANGKEAITKKKKKNTKIQFCVETTGDIFDIQVDLDAKTSTVKNRLINELRLPKTFEDGQPVTYYLRSKTRGETMDDDKTLRKNGVQENEVFVFLIEVDDE